jgi:hypothetical protein
MINTHDPLTVDTDLANTVDILNTCTDLAYIIEHFPTEIAASNVYNFIKYTNNPINDEIQFFIELHNGDLATKDYKGGINPNVDIKKIKVKNINDQLPHTQRVKIDDDLNYSATGENSTIANVDIYRTVIDENTGEIKQEDSKAQYIPIPLTDLDNNTEFKDTVGLSTLYDVRFVVNWLDKFRKAHEYVQEKVKEKLGSENLYYLDFSDSIGILGLTEFTKDSSTTLHWDVDGDDHIPVMYSGSVHHLIDEETRMLMIEMSQRTSTIFRQNISHLGEFYKDRLGEEPITASHAKTPHGVNLVSDISHYVRIHSLKSDFDSILRSTLNGMYDVLFFIRNLEESSKIGKPEINTKIESTISKIDWLGNKINKPRKGTASTDNRSRAVLT